MTSFIIGVGCALTLGAIYLRFKAHEEAILELVRAMNDIEGAETLH